MKKIIIVAVMALASITNSGIQAWNKVVEFSPTVKQGGGIVRYGHSQSATLSNEELENQNYDIATTEKIDRYVAGLCESTYGIRMLNGTFDGEVIGIKNPQTGDFVPVFVSPDGNNCRSHTMYLGTLAEVEQKQKERGGGKIYTGKLNKLAVLID